jgi:nitrile hydratase accessory protein
MAEGDPAAVLAWDGPLSPPRRNGEIVFDTVWQGRLFGMTMALYESGAFRWEEFRDQLITAIAAWERDHRPGDDHYRYWDCWLEAFERLLAEKNICPRERVVERVARFAARPQGHDH